MIEVVGTQKQRRRLVVIEGREIWLTEKSYEVFVVLAQACKNTEDGWVSALEFGDLDTYHQAIRRLKNNLEEEGFHKAEELIKNNASKQYRLNVDRERVQLNE